MADKKPLTKNEWFLKELAKDDYHPSEQALERIFAGDTPECFTDDILDYIELLEVEWDNK